MLQYNVPFGKKNRGLTVVQSYKYLAGDSAKAEDLHLARVLGWCVEMVRATSTQLDLVLMGFINN